MSGPLEIAGAQSAPSDFAPLHVNRMVTGFWTNTSPLRDAATDGYTEKFYGGRQDRIAAGANMEISSKLTLRRRCGMSIYNPFTFPPIKRYYGWNTFTLTDEVVRVMADTAAAVYEVTNSAARPNMHDIIWTKSPGAGSTYFLGVGNTLYFTNGVENKQINTSTGVVSDWGIAAPVNAPIVGGASDPTDAWRYGYAYMDSANVDISNMSPPSLYIVDFGGTVNVQGDGSGATNVDTIVIYRTAKNGSTFFQLDTIPNPGAGSLNWTYADNSFVDFPDNPDLVLNTELQAQVAGEGTPLPVGATCLEYHVGRIFAAVGNVVYVSSGPDAIVSGSSGNAGFDTTFTAQSKVTRFWVNTLGVVVFTVRDAYLIQGSGTDQDPLWMGRFIENLPLLNYDAFALFLTTPYLLTGHRMVNALDPSAGIIEASFPIADQIAALDPKTAYVTFHSGPSGETALYVADGAALWYRMAPTSAPEHGLNWNPPAILPRGTSAVQSVETEPGTMSLLIGPPPPSGGPILQRDTTKNTDQLITYPAFADIGNIVLAHTGQLAGLAWITLESEAVGTPTKLSVMLDETKEKAGSKSAQFTPIPRTRQDPPNLPPSDTIYSNRHSLLQDQKPVWCKSLKLRLEWPAEDAANELDTYAIFGQVWAEQRSQ